VRAAALELQLVALGVSLGLRCGDQERQQQWATVLARLLRRQHLGVHAALQRARGRAGAPADEDERAEDMAGAPHCSHAMLPPVVVGSTCPPNLIRKVSCQVKPCQIGPVLQARLRRPACLITSMRAILR